MQYTFDNRIKTTEENIYLDDIRWTEMKTGERIFGPKSGMVLCRDFLYSVVIVSVLSACFYYFEFLFRYQHDSFVLLIFAITIISHWRGLFDRIVFGNKPVFVLRPDKSIELSRLGQTVVPNETTYFEIIRNEKDDPGNQHDLVLFHEGKTYFILRGSLSTSKTSTNSFEKLYKELDNLYPGEEKTHSERRDTIENERKLLQKSNRSHLGWSLLYFGIILILGCSTLLFLFAIQGCLTAEMKPAIFTAIILAMTFMGSGYFLLHSISEPQP